MKQMKNNKQRGSAHAVLVICLVIALLFALGWIFWQNFVQKHSVNDMNSTANTSSTEPTQVTESVKTTEIQLANEKLFLTIPSDWQSDVQTVKATQYAPVHDNGSIKNAGGTSVLNVTSGISGVGGACDPDTKDTLTVVEATKTKAMVTSSDTSTKSSDVYAVKSYYYDSTKGYAAFMFLTNDKRSEVSGSHSTCLPYLAALFDGRNVQGLVSVTTDGGLDDNGVQAMKFKQTKEQALADLDSDDMKEAYTILQTARY